MNVQWAILPIFTGGMVAVAFGWYFAAKERSEKHRAATKGVVGAASRVEQAAGPEAHAIR